MNEIKDLEITSSRGGVKVETTWEVMTKCVDNERNVDKLWHKTDVSAKRL